MTSEQPKPKRYIALKRITDCNAEQQRKVLEIRNQEAVRKSMYTDHIISPGEHLKWLSNLKSDKKQITFAVLNDEQKPIGVASINAIDTLHKKSDWAFYIDEKERGGLGAAIEYTLIEFVFNNLHLVKLNCEVIETNDVVVKMHQKFFFEIEGLRRSNIEKNGGRVGVVFLGLTKDDWLANKSRVLEKYQIAFDRFSINISID